jgi:hypothetical protein
MQNDSSGSVGDVQDLLRQLCSFFFPAGEERARAVTRIETEERGEFRSSPGGRWVPFTADEYVDATRSAFRWDARIGSGPIASVNVTDAYEQGQGRLVVRKGPITLRKLTGPDVDQGELQRYLAMVACCPSMILNNRALVWMAPGPRSLRVSDREDRTGASLDIEIDHDGRPVAFTALRPMSVGKLSKLTPWSATCSEFEERDGIRTPRRLDASWNLEDGRFTYIRMEIVTLRAVR